MNDLDKALEEDKERLLTEAGLDTIKLKEVHDRSNDLRLKELVIDIMFQNKILKEGIKAYKKLNLCYRLGGQPPDWVFKSIEKLNKFVKDL
jgi:hypothetical protein